MSYLYVAAPYAHADSTVMASRAQLATMIAAQLVQSTLTPVFSPLTQGPLLAQFLPEAMAKQHDFWMHLDVPMLRHASGLVLCPMEGWAESRGVAIELGVATACHIPVHVWQGPGVEVLPPEMVLERGWNIIQFLPEGGVQ